MQPAEDVSHIIVPLAGHPSLLPSLCYLIFSLPYSTLHPCDVFMAHYSARAFVQTKAVHPPVLLMAEGDRSCFTFWSPGARSEAPPFTSVICLFVACAQFNYSADLPLYFCICRKLISVLNQDKMLPDSSCCVFHHCELAPDSSSLSVTPTFSLASICSVDVVIFKTEDFHDSCKCANGPAAAP